MPEQTEKKIDFRLYIGLFFFYWQTIAVCFLYALFIAVLYIQLAPKQYETSCKLMVHRDVNLEISDSGQASASPLRSFSIHSYFLKSEALRKQVVDSLVAEWGQEMGTPQKMLLDVEVESSRDVGSALDIRVETRKPRYAEAFLTLLLEAHEKEWNSIKSQGSASASVKLQEELDKLSENIEKAENDLIEYQRLHDIARVEASASMESQYLSALMSRQSMLTTELMLLESQSPMLKNANAAVISDVGRLTRETGEIEPEPEEVKEDGKDGEGGDKAMARLPRVQLPEELTKKVLPNPDGENAGSGSRDLRVKLLQLEQKEKELIQDLQVGHPRVKELRKEMSDIRSQLELAANIELGRLTDRHNALMIQKSAVEKAIYQWQAKNLLSSKRRSELKRLSNVLDRFQRNYDTLYSRLHDMLISEEMRSEHFRMIEKVKTDSEPVWPDPLKVLMVALVLGLGSGFGFALMGHTLNNKIQTIQDVESEVGVPFLGGVPFWVHSGLEKTVRPIVTEESSSGATEAYRSLRTGVLAALDKAGEKILLVTSADSREGKTLTTLNLSIMIAQMGKKVLLVDMDLRRGRMHRSLGVEREPGMTSVLDGKHKLRDVVMKTRFDNLSVVPSGKSLDNVSERLQVMDIKGMFEEIRDEYDYIIIDTSPVLRVTDTVILATQGVGSVLYVARVNKTPKPMIMYSLGLLEDARVLGLVMNSIEMHKISSLYYAYQYPSYAYYSNAYAYGHDYYYDDHAGKKRGRRRQHENRSWRHQWHSFEKWVRRTFLPME